MPADSQKRRYIPRNSGKSCDVAPLSYGNKLVRSGQTAEPGPVLDFAVTSYLDKIAHNNLVSKYAIVSDVSADHNEIIIANLRLRPGVNARMDCYLFVNDVSIAHHKSADFGV